MIICLETATNLCSVALCDDNGVIALKESVDQKSHSSLLTVFIIDILKENGIKPRELEAVAVSKGPGSYTGLRIGVSVAKGIAYAASIPLIAVETTYSMFWGIKEKLNSNMEDSQTLYCPMIDARRSEVYFAIYDSAGKTVKNITAEVITEESFNYITGSGKIMFFGDGSAKCREIIKRQNSYFDTDYVISASNMYIPAYQALKNGVFENVAYFEPFYLKDFITSKPRKNIL
jgi:tRNA threonylcarbamoyladenosine biosynthesis protein TsaB